jgi:hypothetical protein
MYGGCKTVLHNELVFDDRYRFVSGEDEVSLFTHAGIYKDLGENAHLLKKDYAKDYHWNLYQRSYIGWSSECEDKGMGKTEIYAQIKDIYKVNFWQSIFNFI